jgi:hypothetical protein
MREVLHSILIEFGLPLELLRMIKICVNEMYSRVCISKHLPDNFPIQISLRKDAVSPMQFNFILGYVLRKAHENQLGLKLNGTHPLLTYADVNLLKDDVDTIKKSTGTLKNASKEVGLEVDADKTNYMLSRHHNAGQNDFIKLTNKSFENVIQLKYLGTTVINRNLNQKEVKRRLNSGNAYS